jgi:transposase-like protein
VVARYEASGLSRREFAARNDIGVSALQYWRRKVAVGGGGPASMRFVEVIGSDPGSESGGVTLEFCDGLTLRFETLPSPSYLAEVAAALAGE